jgi:hypothetical protein
MTLTPATRFALNGKSSKVGLFNNLTANWVENQHDKDPDLHLRTMEFHIWTVAIFKGQDGRTKHMVMWDCDK